MMAMKLPIAERSGLPCDCRYGDCRYRVSAVRSWIIAYREAVKGGEDPAEYIKDSIRPSRPTCPPCHYPDPIDPAIYAQNRTSNRSWHVEAKVELERARDVGGIPLFFYNAERVAAFLCERWAEAQAED